MNGEENKPAEAVPASETQAPAATETQTETSSCEPLKTEDATASEAQG